MIKEKKPMKNYTKCQYIIIKICSKCKSKFFSMHSQREVCYTCKPKINYKK